MSETSYRGLTHTCGDPECHVVGFVATLEHKDDEAFPQRVLDDLYEHHNTWQEGHDAPALAQNPYPRDPGAQMAERYLEKMSAPLNLTASDETAIAGLLHRESPAKTEPTP